MKNVSSRYEILTDDGWSNLKGIKKFSGYNHRIITFEDGSTLKCTYNHKIYLSDYTVKKAYKVQTSDKVLTRGGNKSVLGIKKYFKKKNVYDVVDVSKNNRFYANDVLVSNSEEFWASNYPTISASKESKIIVISTPNGMWNLFHRIYMGGEKGRNTFKTMRLSWKDDPSKNEDWAKEQIKNLGKQKFTQEYGVQFLGSTNTVVDSDVLEVLMTEYKEPSFVDMKGKMLIYEKPQQGDMYVIGNDVAKGTGEHYSVSQVLKIVSMKPIKLEQVAVYISNKVDVYTFSDIIDRLSYYYNHAYIMVENNSEGAAVVNRLWWEHENENLVNTGSKAINLGIRATRNTKPRAVLLMKKLIEDGSLKLYDIETIEELTSFIEDNGRFYGKDREDDCVSALYWAVYIFNMNILDDTIEFERKQEDEEDGWGVLTDINTNGIDVDWSWLTDISDG